MEVLEEQVVLPGEGEDTKLFPAGIIIVLLRGKNWVVGADCHWSGKEQPGTGVGDRGRSEEDEEDLGGAAMHKVTPPVPEQGGEWESLGGMWGKEGEASAAFLDVRNVSLIAFLSASDTAWLVCPVSFLAPFTN